MLLSWIYVERLSLFRQQSLDSAETQGLRRMEMKAILGDLQDWSLQKSSDTEHVYVLTLS